MLRILLNIWCDGWIVDDRHELFNVLGEQVIEQRAVLREKPHEIVTLCLEVRILLEKHVCLICLLLDGLNVWR